ncbi:MAG: porin [Succinatimonas sp.]|nr:porin [Succinatimonas sp.]
MKKTLLAAAVVSALVASTAASAATVYDKDGTVLNVNGRIEAQWYNAGSSNNMTGKVANNDSSIYNWARMSMDGRSKLNDYATAFGKMEWDVADGDQRDGMSARDQFIGVDFGKFGKVQTGRYKSLLQTVVAVTDVLAGDGESGKTYVIGDTRNAGKLTYTWNGYGVLLGAEYQSAKDDYSEHGNTFNVESGYSLIAGYTTPAVLFGPISIKAGYSYMGGQDDSNKAEVVDNQSGWAASLAWGTPSAGWYFAGEYSAVTYDYRGAKDDLDGTGFEIVGKYSFGNGLSLATGYQYEKWEQNGESEASSQVPLVAEYNFNPNFKVYAQANFGVNEDEGRVAGAVAPTLGDGNAFAVGARYTF